MGHRMAEAAQEATASDSAGGQGAKGVGRAAKGVGRAGEGFESLPGGCRRGGVTRAAFGSTAAPRARPKGPAR